MPVATSSFYISVFLCVGLLLYGCDSPPPPRPPDLQAITSVATIDMSNPDVLCDLVTEKWEQDWPGVLQALESLVAMDATCNSPGFVIEDRFYTAYMGYGTLLEARGRQAEAINAYQQALTYDFDGQEAVARLRALDVFTPEPPPGCAPDVVNGFFRTLPQYTPTDGAFVAIQDDQFTLSGQPYPVYGINYYPRDYPFERFLTQMNVESIDFELEIMQASGINTLRIFLRHEDLFTCFGNGAVPIASNIARLDDFVQQVATRNFKLILVLNDAPDLVVFPLYDSPTHTMQQMAFLATRYRDEPAIMAYDLRDNAQLDYTGDSMQFTRPEVLTWLVEAAQLMREQAPNHLITAGWGDDSESTVPFVDFVSFQHWGEVEALRQEIAVLKAATTRPIVLTAFGYNTFDMDELGQRQAIQRAIEATRQNNLAGWLIWTAFDYPLNVLCTEPDCPAVDSARNRYGLWNTSYFPKRALDAVHLVTGGEGGEQ